jgi:hypothetical protein
LTTKTYVDAGVTTHDTTAGAHANRTLSGDLGGTLSAPTVLAITVSGPTSLVNGAVADGSILERVGGTLVGSLLSADVIKRDGSVPWTGNSDFGTNDITNVGLVDGVDVALVAGRTHVWGLTVNGPLTAAKTREQVLVIPFTATITKITVTANEPVATGNFVFDVDCGPDDDAYVGGDRVGSVTITTGSPKQVASGTLSFGVVAGDRLSVSNPLPTGTQTNTDHRSNFNVAVEYTRPIT